MIPVATSNSTNGCAPISSNCVLWQGPDIPCIDLCHGDTVSDVVYKLATELCDLLDATNIQGIDFSCLNLQVAPSNQKELIQAIIDASCSLDSRCTALEGGNQGGGSTSTIVATLPACLQYTNQQNDFVTELPIDEYAELVAARVCILVGDITALNTQVSNHENRIVSLENAVNNNQSTMVQVLPNCIMPSVLTDIDEVVETLEAEYCNLSNALGGTSGVLSVSGMACSNLNNQQSLSGVGVMSSITGWNSTVLNLSQSLQNMWLTICDIRSAVQTIQDTCCSVDCNDVIFTYIVNVSNDNTVMYLDFNGSSLPNGFSQTSVLGTAVNITDGVGNSFTDYVDIEAAISTGSPESILLTGSGLNVGSGLTVEITLSVNNGAIDCAKSLTKSVGTNFTCPAVQATVTETTIEYTFLNQNGAVNYNVALKQGTTTVTTNTISGAGNVVSGSFSGLTAGTTYTIVVTISSGSASQTCEAAAVTTTAGQACDPPVVISATITNTANP